MRESRPPQRCASRSPPSACLPRASWASAPRATAATDALWALQGSLQGCVESSQPQPCRQAEARVKGLTRNPAYAKASHLCKEEIGELSQIVGLLPLRDAVPTEVMASVADVQQACLPYGF